MAIVYTDEKHYQNIANSIRAKLNSSETYLPDEMSAAIDEIATDTTAKSNDIADNKTAYINGAKVTGTLQEFADGSVIESDDMQMELTDGVFKVSVDVDSDRILRTGARNVSVIQASDFGDAEPADVLSGKTFTSSSGLKIEGIAAPPAEDGGIDTSDATAVESDILVGKTAYANNVKLIGTMQTVEQATPSITIDSSGIITASATQDAGKVESGTKSATLQLATQEEKIITPSTLDQTVVDGGVYVTGAITVLGDENLIAENIKSGATIFGVTGNAESAIVPTIDVSDSGLITATAGSKSSTQQLPIQAAKTVTPSTSNQTAVSGGLYTTGEVVVAGDTNLISDNIKSGVSIFGVTGTAESGIDTSDATATASDMASGKTAYVNGEKVSGNLNEIKSGQSIAANGTAYLGYGTEWLVGASYQFPSDKIWRAGSTIHVSAPASEFGDATAADVTAGKTFTSAEGLKVVGDLNPIIDKTIKEQNMTISQNSYGQTEFTILCDGMTSASAVLGLEMYFQVEKASDFWYVARTKSAQVGDLTDAPMTSCHYELFWPEDDDSFYITCYDGYFVITVFDSGSIYNYLEDLGLLDPNDWNNAAGDIFFTTT